MASWYAQKQGACEDDLDHYLFGDKQNRNRDIFKVGIFNMKKVHIIFGMRYPVNPRKKTRRNAVYEVLATCCRQWRALYPCDANAMYTNDQSSGFRRDRM